MKDLYYIDFLEEDYEVFSKPKNRLDKDLDINSNSFVDYFDNDVLYSSVITSEEQYEGHPTYFE